jgi:hypothetical protein
MVGSATARHATPCTAARNVTTYSKTPPGRLLQPRRSGPEPTTNGFMAVMHGPETKTILIFFARPNLLPMSLSRRVVQTLQSKARGRQRCRAGTTATSMPRQAAPAARASATTRPTIGRRTRRTSSRLEPCGPVYLRWAAAHVGLLSTKPAAPGRHTGLLSVEPPLAVETETSSSRPRPPAKRPARPSTGSFPLVRLA